MFSLSSVPLFISHFTIRYNLILLFLLINLFTLSAQSEGCVDNKTNTWYFGNYAGLSFNTDPPAVLFDGAMTNKEGVSSISNKATGRVLFYTNGVTVWDSTNQPMPNGNGLLGRFDAEQNAIVPYPDHPNLYYIFTTTHWNGTFYSIVDMSLNNGKGDIDITQKNIMLIGGWGVGQVRASDKITFTKHANKKDYWMVTHLTFNDSFYVYQINSNGIQQPVGFKIGANETPTNPELGGVLKFNRAGDLLVNCQPYDGAPQSKLQGFYFNRNTGTIDSIRFSIENIWFPYGVEFSSNNQYMYVAHPIINNIDQFDLTSNNIPASVINIHNYNPNLTRVGQMQIAPDNKIYVAQTKNYNTPYRYLGVINEPNNLGTACNFVQDAVDLYPNASFFGLPSSVCEIDEYKNPDTCYSKNLIVNGDFEMGDTGFLSDYSVYNINDSLYRDFPDSIYPSGTYKVTNVVPNHISDGGGYVCTNIINDHTQVGNKMLFIMPYDTIANVLFWNQQVNTTSNKSYKFTFFAKSTSLGTDGEYNGIRVIINNDTIYNKYLTPSICNDTWTLFDTILYFNDSIQDIRMENLALESPNNNFVVDDISLQEIISCNDSIQQCAYTDTFNCKTLTFITDSSRFCVPIILSSDSAAFKNNGFQFCMSYDTNFVKPTGIYNKPFSTNDFTIVVDSIVKGKICVSITNVQHITFTSNHEIDLGCIQFVLDNELFNSVKTFDYLSFQIIDGCNNNLQTINAWLTEDLEYWETEDGRYWKLEE